MTDYNLPINNPAERLLVILTRFSQASKEKTILEVMSTTLEFKPDKLYLFQGVIEFYKLIDNIEEQIKYLSVRKRDSYQALLKNIRTSFANLASRVFTDIADPKWGIAAPLNNPEWEVLKYLLACIDDLEEYRFYLSQEKLNDIRNEINSLIENIEKSKLNIEFKQFLLIKLRDVRNVIEEYYKYGTTGLRKEIIASLVEINLLDNESGKDNQTEESKNLLAKTTYKLWEIAQRLNTFMDTGIKSNQVISLVSQIIQSLPPGGNGS